MQKDNLIQQKSFEFSLMIIELYKVLTFQDETGLYKIS